MNEKIKASIINKFFENSDFRLLANAIPHGLIIINEKGNISFINQYLRDLCGTKDLTMVPFVPYRQGIRPEFKEIVVAIDDIYAHKTDVIRQINKNNKIYLLESKVVFNEDQFIGCTITCSDITELAVREKQHELLYQISSALSGVTNVNQILRIAISQILKSVNVSAVNIMFLEPKSQTLKIKIDSNHRRGKHKAREIKLGEGVAGKCASELRPYSVFDIATSDLFTQKRPEDTGALLVVPIMSRGKLFGVLNAWDKNPRFFTENEVQFLTIVANEIAIALENGRLYEKLKHRVDYLSKLFWTTSFIGVKTLDKRISKIVELTPNLVDAEDCRLYLYSPTKNRLLLHSQANAKHTCMKTIDLSRPDTIISKRILFDHETLLCNDPEDYKSSYLFKNTEVENFIATPLFIENKSIGILIATNKISGEFDEEDKDLLAITAHRISTKLENAHLMQSVEAEKELLDRVIENTSEGVTVLDSKKRIIVWNKYLEELTGINSKEIIGLPSYKIFYNRLGLQKLTRELYALDRNISELRKPFLLEERVTDIHGDKVWVSAISSHIIANNAIENTIIVFRNISKDKELLEAKNEFISITTHELRTPITATKGYLSMIMNGDAGAVAPKQKEYFKKAYDATERLSSLVEELLDVMRIDEERVKFNFIEFSLNKLTEETMDNFQSAAKAKSLQLLYCCDDTTLVCADREKTKQVLSNLVDNAIKYTRDRGKIAVSFTKESDMAHIQVRDTGVGIPSRSLQTIFDRFVRIPNSLSVRAGGAGLGLYIVKNLVEKQGGRIWVESHLGKGTTFHFTVPLSKASVQSDQKAKSIKERSNV